MIDENETFAGTWPYKAQYFSGQGFRQHYVDEGSRSSDETFVLLHGEPTWGYIYRNLIPGLSAIGRVIVPDHMGFGKSETPQDRDYSAEGHCDNLDALLRSLDLRDITLVMQDWGGPIGTNFALRDPGRIKRLFYIDTIPRIGVPAGIDMAALAEEGLTPWAEFFTSEAYLPVMSHLSKTILSVLKLIGFERNEIITPDWIQAYAAPFPTPESCKGAIAFPLDNLNPGAHSYLEAAMKKPGVLEALGAKPVMMVMGEEDRQIPEVLASSLFREIWPDAKIIKLPNVGHFAQEDAPETLATMIEKFVNSH